MHVVFKKLDEWFKKDPDLKDKYHDTIKFLQSAIKVYTANLNQTTTKVAGVNIDLEVSELLLEQSLIDAFDDLMRLRDYHPIKAPNPLKEMSYIVFWLLRHKPISLDSEAVIRNTELSDMFRTRLLFINESFCVNMLIGSAFPELNVRDDSKGFYDEGQRQLQYFKKFLLYYLVYRVDSPKALEAILMGTTMFPAWDVDPIIWSDPKAPEEGY